MDDSQGSVSSISSASTTDGDTDTSTKKVKRHKAGREQEHSSTDLLAAVYKESVEIRKQELLQNRERMNALADLAKKKGEAEVALANGKVREQDLRNQVLEAQLQRLKAGMPLPEMDILPPRYDPADTPVTDNTQC